MYYACMVALQIRDVPDDIRDTLAARAAARGQSLQSYLLTLVSEEARRSANLMMLERFTGRQDGSQLSVAEALEGIDRDRGERAAHLAGPNVPV